MTTRRMYVLVSFQEPADKETVMEYLTVQVDSLQHRMSPGSILHGEFKDPQIKEVLKGDKIT